MNGFFVLLCLAFLAFSSLASASGPSTKAVATFVATAIVISNGIYFYSNRRANAAISFNSFANPMNISGNADWPLDPLQDPLALYTNPIPVVSSYRHRYAVAKNKLPATSIALVDQQENADPDSGHTSQLTWAYMAIITVSFCGAFASLRQDKQSIKKVIAAHDELARVVYSMPNSLFGVNTEKLAELKNEIDNIKSLLNINIADSNDVAHKTMKCATELKTLTRQMSNLPVELFNYTPADAALAAGHAARNLIVESDDSVGNANSDDGDGTAAGTSTKSDDETGGWQTVVAKRIPRAANRGQNKPKRNRKAKK